jgi:hypothetical protein
MHRLFGAAVDEELIERNPVRIPRRALPAPRDKDPLWRLHTPRGRAADLRCAPPEDRRLVHAIMFLGGLRFGEVAALAGGPKIARQSSCRPGTR